MGIGRERAALAVSALAVAAAVGVAAPAHAVPALKITSIRYDPAGDDLPVTTAKLNMELVVIKNTTTSTKTITGWTVRDAQNHVYTFPTTSIPAGKQVAVHTGTGTNNATNQYWRQGNYIWNNSGDKATVKNSAGTTIDSCSYTAAPGGIRTCP